MGQKIFLSVGRTFTQQQEDFVSSLEEFMEAQGVTPQTVGRTYFSSKQPLVAVLELMEQCAGTIILAFERTYVVEAFDKRSSENENKIENVKLTTVWNQIEAAMAYTQDHPLLVIMEEDLKEEGLLERGYDWFVLRVDLGKNVLSNREFIGVFSDWKRRVEAFARSRETAAARKLAAAKAASKPAQVSVPVSMSKQPESEQKPGKIRILFLTANPTDTNRLRLDEENRAIDQSLRRAEYRDRFELEQFQAVQVTDLQECLLRFEPHIVHFSGHGSEAGEILLQDRSGISRPVSARALERLFAVLKDNIRCVVLNACYSEVQAEAIAKHIDAVVGMSTAIGDEAAISFSAAFYQALAYGRDLSTAYQLGTIQIEMEDIPESETPHLLSPNSDPTQIYLAAL